MMQRYFLSSSSSLVFYNYLNVINGYNLITLIRYKKVIKTIVLCILKSVFLFSTEDGNMDIFSSFLIKRIFIIIFFFIFVFIWILFKKLYINRMLKWKPMV